MTVGETTVLHPSPLDLVTVPVESDVFTAMPDAPLYMGRVAVPGQVLMAEEFKGHAIFRGNVYIDELAWLPESSRDEEGKELDRYDANSIHFTALANTGAGDNPRVVGVSRLIVKPENGQPLPIESYFPEAFENELPAGSIEASRFIARHANPRVQRAIALASIRSVILEAVEIDTAGVYATVEKPLKVYFERLGMPLSVLSAERMLSDYGDTNNMAIMFNPQEVIDTAALPAMADKQLGRIFNIAAQSDSGVGYFDSMMEQRIL